MSSYFDQIEQTMGDAVERLAHKPWHVRLLRRVRRHPGPAVVIIALVVATPAVAAVSGWFNFGKPNVPPPAKAGYMYGLEKPGSARLLPLRVADPGGGPPWGLRMVRTSRGDTCVQYGRVENGQIGSLGIDDSWGNDDKFHAISAKDSADDQCGSTDAAGHGYVNVSMIGTDASANIYHQGQGSGRTSQGCAPPQYLSAMGLRHLPARFRNHAASNPACPANGARILFFGMLGPDATSVTYRKPGGGLARMRTSGGVGAYLLVFPYNKATCYEYSHSLNRSVSCDSESMGTASPSSLGAITKITYKDGHSCTVTPSATMQAAYKRFTRTVQTRLGRPTLTRVKPQPGLPSRRVSPKWLAAYEQMLRGFLSREHLSMAEFKTEFGGFGQCPAVGWVASKGPKITPADVATPIMIRELPAGKYPCPTPARLHLPQGCSGYSPMFKQQVPVEWSFKAREAVTNSRHWYEWSVSPVSSQTGTNCGGSSFATYTNIRKGQILRYSQLFPTTCRGRYTVAVGYMAAAPPQATDNTNGGGGGTPGRDGSIIVGRATFTIR